MISDIEDAIKTVNDGLYVHHKMTGKYPIELIQKLVEDWFSDTGFDVEEVLELISHISNTEYLNTALSHLSKISGVDKDILKKSLYKTEKEHSDIKVISENTDTSTFDGIYKYLISILIIFVYWYFVVTASSIEPWVKILMFVFGPIVIGKLSDLFLKTNLIT